jgi:DNA gyrase subunit A
MSEQEEGHGLPKVIPINIEEEMKTAYIDYSMSVIVSRALPDVRDGLKPVHRRVLYGMQQMGVLSNRPYKKSARVVGDVMGKYHPHGDAAVYDTMVRMAQHWSLRYPLIDGQGNFGSIDNDPPAAMRYTEVRLRKIAEEMSADLDKDTVDFKPNYNDEDVEPTVLPTRIPQLLVNGASGIAVGMATNILPHNLSEVIDACVLYIDNKNVDVEEIIQHIKAPDFPTGGIIYGMEGVKEGFRTGRGKVKVRGRAVIEENDNGRTQIIVTEIPYQVNKASLIMKAADLVNDKKIEGITDIRDESDKHGIRIVFDLKRDAIPNVVLNNLYSQTPLQTSYGINNIALVNGRPVVLNVKDMIRHFIDFRHEVVVRRTRYELDQAEKRAHILEGLLIALDHLDAVIALIRKSATPDEARDGLVAQFGLSEIQAKAILEMRLQRLTGLERDKIRDEYNEVQAQITRFKEILGSEEIRMNIIKDELLEIKKKYGDERRTEIIFHGDDISMEDLIADEAMVVTISHMGYIKRTPLDEYRKQGRGGRGAVGGKTREEDYIEHLFIATAHNYLMLFTEKGKCFWLRVFEIPEGSRQSKGRPVQNLVNLDQDDKVKAFINVETLSKEEFLDSHFILMATKSGILKKTSLRNYSRPRSNGIIAITVREGDELLTASLTNGNCEILLGTKYGYAIRFNEQSIRPIGRTGSGVKGVTLRAADDEVVGMVVVDTNAEEFPKIMVVSERGFGKRSMLEDYRITGRGGKGIKTLNITEKTGSLVAIMGIAEDDDLMIITRSGIAIRTDLEEVRVKGRNTQGVSLIKVSKDDEIAAVTPIVKEDEIEEAEESGAEGEATDGGINVKKTDEEAPEPENGNVE